jgi:hypothetical protein
MDTLVRDLDAEMAVVAGHLNVAHAHAVALIAEALERDDWKSHGVHSPEHWARLHLGVNETQARQLVRVARRFAEFPDTMAEFTAGGLSLAQVEVVVTRAPEWADTRMAGFAQGLSVSQLRSMVRDEFFEHDPAPPAPPAPHDAPEPATADDPAPATPDPRIVVAARPDHFGYEWRDGRLVVFGNFAADRGSAIEAILDNVRDELFRATGQPASGAEALAEIIARAGAAPGGVVVSGEWGNGSRLADVLGRVRTHLHLEIGDAGTRLVGHLSNGVRLPQAVCQYLTCDGTITPVWVRDHIPFGYGRDQRVVPVKMRRYIEYRDRGCRVPGCGCTTIEIHHIIHWSNGGVTETWNLVSLCPRHHRMHHTGQLTITGNPDHPDGLEFRDMFGELIAASKPVKPTAPPAPPPHQFTPATLERISLREFYGWTEAGARNARRLTDYRANHPPGQSDDPDNPDPNRN